MNNTDQENLTQLRHNLNAYFNKDEMRSLCFDLGIDYENLPEAKEGIVRELIRIVVRTQQLDTLLELCRELRPHITWPDFSPDVAAALDRTSISPTRLSKREQKERKKQLILLDKVKKFWVKGVLENLVPDDKLLALGRHVSTEMIDHPWHDVVDTAVYDTHTLDTYKNILDIFIESDRALLILGEPGAGKTTTLLELARELVAISEQDPSQPIPVVLNLSSWTEKREAITDWAVEELSNKYQIPRKTSRPWLENDNLLLLLDGLDEVPDKFREACVHRINEFRAEQGLTGLVVSSRSYEYEAIGTKLKLDGAVLLQSLTPDQVDSYLGTFGSRLASLRTAIQQDVILKEMAQSPLMLKVMSVAYENSEDINQDGGVAAPNLEPSQAEPDKTLANYHEQLFETYVRRMLHQRDNSPYTSTQTKKWLAWLAQRMTDHNQTIFLVEQMQPSWFVSRRGRWFYLIGARLISGCFAGLAAWLMMLIGKQVDSKLSIEIIEQFEDLLPLPQAIEQLVPILLLTMSIGLVVAGIDGLYFERRSDDQRSGNHNREWQRSATVGSTATFIAFFITLLFDPVNIAALVGLIIGLMMFMAASILMDGESFSDDIKTTEALGWSWSNSLKGVIIGIVPGIITGWLGTLVFDSNTGWLYAFSPSYIIMFLLLGGLQKNKLETKSRPNQGIRLSASNAILTTLLFGIPPGLIFGFAVGPTAGLMAGVVLGPMAGSVYGGANVMKHFGLRLLFWYKDYIPFNYISFLNHASRHVLLHKVGGGYVFEHRLLQDYFANLDVVESDE